MSAADKIAIVALFLAAIVPTIQGFWGRRREWHEACDFLCKDIDTLFADINSLVLLEPSEVNHITYQYYLERRLLLFQLVGKRFFSKKSAWKRQKT